MHAREHKQIAKGEQMSSSYISLPGMAHLMAQNTPDSNQAGWGLPKSRKSGQTQSPICSGDDGLSGELDGLSFSKLRKESIKGYGNAVVVPLVVEIFRGIEVVEKQQVIKM